MAKKAIISEFVPREVDSVATEVSPGMVKVQDIPDLIPLSDYLANKAEHLQFLRTREAALYRDVRDYIKQSLSIRSTQWQEECRRLSWSYTANSDQSLLKGLVKICPDMTLLSPTESEVTAHHTSHFIRAFLATIENLAPEERGTACNLVYRAKEVEESLQAKILCWEYLLSLRKNTSERPIARRQTQIDLLLQQNEKILAELAAIHQLLSNKKGKNNGAI